MKINSYPKVWNVGHPRISGIFEDGVLIEEKIDGSQISFGLIGGELFIRSKGQQIFEENPEKMFALGVETIKNLKDKLKPEWFYRCEYLSKPKHNVLAYDRVPTQNIIIFDINTGVETYLPYGDKALEAKRIGLEVVQSLGIRKISNLEDVLSLLETESGLGGQKIEGMVFKNYIKFGRDGKCLLGKYVSEKFKEKHKVDWKAENKTNKDIITLLGECYRTPARWEKSIIHLREKGLLESSPRDIGILLKEIQTDLELECLEEISQKLLKHAMPHIKRSVTRGFPEWYKQQLLEMELNRKETNDTSD